VDRTFVLALAGRSGEMRTASIASFGAVLHRSLHGVCPGRSDAELDDMLRRIFAAVHRRLREIDDAGGSGAGRA
jgi:hypothetical protein